MALTHNIADIRSNYCKKVLTEDSVAQDPINQFQVWLEEAIQAQADEPTAFVLSTVSADGKPTARVVLLKEVDQNGFTFFTNYSSRKGEQLAQNPHASFTFFWPALERQVRIEGEIKKAAGEVSDAYFHSRPKGSQIGAWASPQSQVIASREELEAADKALTEKYEHADQVPRPAHWGGYVLTPSRIEFWQGRPNRLHDRILFEKAEQRWKISRLAP